MYVKKTFTASRLHRLNHNAHKSFISLKGWKMHESEMQRLLDSPDSSDVYRHRRNFWSVIITHALNPNYRDEGQNMSSRATTTPPFPKKKILPPTLMHQQAERKKSETHFLFFIVSPAGN